VEHFTIATVAEQSADFRRVLWTGEHTQLVIMTIPVDGEIGEEIHEVDQILTFVNTGVNPLVLYTVYGPAEHAPKAVHKTKEEADALEEAGKDEPPTQG
jgi:mannose-6-phosphate isomerase-like protein (cupin superfamily)